MGYEQMELDVTLTCDRELKDNVGLAVEFACRQIAAQNQKVVESNHEGYGIAAEGKVALDSAMKKVSDDMKLLPPHPSGRQQRGNQRGQQLEELSYRGGLRGSETGSQCGQNHERSVQGSAERDHPDGRVPGRPG